MNNKQQDVYNEWENVVCHEALKRIIENKREEEPEYTIIHHVTLGCLDTILPKERGLKYLTCYINST